MLEQRKNRKYFNIKTRETLDAVIECSFVSSSDGMTILNPHNTDSSNMSQWSTSSIPYHDGKVRNRDFISLGTLDTTKWKFLSNLDNIRQTLLLGPGRIVSVIKKRDS
jgi:uncharacterized protein YvpB